MSTNRSIIVLIGGGHAAGKRTTANLIRDKILKSNSPTIDIELIDMKDYEETNTMKYSSSKPSVISIEPADKKLTLRPSRFDFDKLRNHLLQNLETPVDQPQKLFLIHGLYALYDTQLRELSHIKVFVAGDADARLIQWIKRDVIQLSTHNLNYVLNKYIQTARQEMIDFIGFTKEFADVIIPRGGENTAVELIVDGIFKHLLNSGYDTLGNLLRPSDDSKVLKDQFGKNQFYELS
jgi:uridine kinase